MWDGQGRIIKWEHIKLLQELQSLEGLKFANKLGLQHIKFQQHKMKVKIAAQTLSASVGNALDFLKAAGVPGFGDVEGTVTFFRTMDRMFDFLNSRSKFAKGYKHPISRSSVHFWSKVVDATAMYLEELQGPTGALMSQHSRRTFVQGFIMTSKAVLRVASNLLMQDEASFQYVLTYRMSQDHLELLFRCLRGKNGFNTNPDTLQFRSSLRQLLLKNSI